ncbi:MAG: Divergent domain protein [Planctomycetaceae bacterium]|nr:Divergent domain protein [Planctomycetaceae bacterium]
MLHKPFEQISKSDVDALVANGACESRTLEFKRILPANGESDRKEFLADVSSFANSAGGILYFGIDATDGVATGASGLGANTNLDAEILRLEALIRDGIEPRIPGIITRKIEGFSGGPIIAIYIPRSWASPHMVTLKGASRFFVRNSAGKHQMDVAEIRGAFALSEQVPERIRRFRLDRIAKLIAGEVGFRRPENPTVILHLVPLSAFTFDALLPPVEMHKRRENFPPMTGGADSIRYNLDGLVAFGPVDSKSKTRGYCQLFRSGIVESVDVNLISDFNIPPLIASLTFERDVIANTQRYRAGQKVLGITGPIAIMLSILDAKGYEMATSPGRRKIDRTPIEQDELILPEVLSEGFDQDDAELLRPIFDALWNASGFPESPYYDERGKWCPK